MGKRSTLGWFVLGGRMFVPIDAAGVVLATFGVVATSLCVVLEAISRVE